MVRQTGPQKAAPRALVNLASLDVAGQFDGGGGDDVLTVEGLDVEKRHRIEGCATNNLYGLKSMLLSYQSASNTKDKYGSIHSAPRDYAHTCLLGNDWTPLSQSREPKEAAGNAAAGKAAAEEGYIDRVKQRMRVCMCDPSSPDSTPVIAFATFETDGRGIRRLRLHRGHEILAYLSVTTLTANLRLYVNDLLVLSPKVATAASPPLCLKFKDRAHLDRFCGMFVASLNQ